MQNKVYYLVYSGSEPILILKEINLCNQKPHNAFSCLQSLGINANAQQLLLEKNTPGTTYETNVALWRHHRSL